MEHTSDLVYEGKLIHETSFPQRSDRYSEVELDGVKIDYYDAKNKVIHEVKKSDSRELAHEWQIKYYMYVLKQNGIDGVTGILEYPKLRETREILLSDRDCIEIEEIKHRISLVINGETCPNRLDQKQCKRCSYFDFCWIGEGGDMEDEV